ncbi:MAG: hypothetical protein AB8B51_20015 [Sedimentitalea sp.]
MLALAARHGRLVLIAGLVAGVALPGLAQVMSRYIPEMVALIMFLGTLRLSPRDLRDLRTRLGRACAVVLALQLALPLALIAVFALFGALNSPLAMALVLLAAAPSIVGSPNIAALMGLPAAPAMQLLVLGTLILPVTILPLFWLMPALGGFETVLWAALRLLALILVAGGGALALRAALLPNPSEAARTRLDGASVIGLAVFVIGLMPALSGAVGSAPLQLVFWMIVVFVANFGAQILCYRFGSPLGDARGPTALVAGNRNVSLFFAALPGDLMAPLLLFLGCYQVPMFLTPILMGWLYRSRAGSAA